MKFFTPIIFAFLIIIFTPKNNIAQLMEWNDQPHQFMEINAINYAGNGKWLLGGKGDNGTQENFYFSKVDSTNLIQGIGSQNIGNIEKIKTRGEFGNVLTNGNSRNIRRCIFSNATWITSTKHELSNYEIVNDFEILPNGSIVIVGYRVVNSEQKVLLKILNSALQVEYEDVFTSGYYSDVMVFNDTSFIVFGGIESSPIIGGRKYNKYYEHQGDILESVESDEVFKYGDEGFLLLKDQELIMLDSNFQLLTTTTFTADFGNIIDMEVDDENGFLLFQKENEAPKILKINHDLEKEIAFSIENELFIAKAIGLSENEIGVGGYLNSTASVQNITLEYSSTSAFFKTYSKNGNLVPSELDLEMVAVEIYDHERITECGTSNNPESYTLNLKNIKITFVNKGTTKISRATIFLELRGLQNCDITTPPSHFYYEKQDLSVLQIEPGDTLVWRIDPIEIPKAITDTSTVEMCVWHTSINFKQDQNGNNNHFCGELILGKDGYVETPIIEPTDKEYLLFPNPIKETMTVSLLQSPPNFTTIEFYDYVGRKIVNTYFIAPRAKYKEFDMSELPTGFYFVRIYNELIDESTKVYKE